MVVRYRFFPFGVVLVNGFDVEVFILYQPTLYRP